MWPQNVYIIQKHKEKCAIMEPEEWGEMKSDVKYIKDKVSGLCGDFKSHLENCRARHTDDDSNIADIRKELAVLKVKAGLYGMVAGGLTALIPVLVMIYKMA